MALDKKLLQNNGKTPEELSDFDLADYLIEHPERTDCVRFDRMNSEAWTKLLSHRPEFADKCNFYKLSKESASTLICRYPEWIWRFRSKPLDWGMILSERPELIDFCPSPGRLAAHSWVRILSNQPQLESYCPWHKLDGRDWAVLLKKQICFADRCPWEKQSFFMPLKGTFSAQDEAVWQVPLLCHREVILHYRPDWKKYDDVSLLNEFQLVAILLNMPGTIEKYDLNILSNCAWMRLLLRHPDLIKYCDTKKVFKYVPLYLINKHPELADYFDWENVAGDDKYNLQDLIKDHPELIPRCLNSMEAEDWEYLLQKSPEYLLKRKGEVFTFSGGTAAFAAADFWSFEETGLDVLCNKVFRTMAKQAPDPGGLFQDFYQTRDPAVFLLQSSLDLHNARLFVKWELLRNNWLFFEKLHDFDPQAIHRFLPVKDVPFLWIADAPLPLVEKYLNTRRNIPDISDKNGNTLLHAALLRTLFCETVDFSLDGNTPGQIFCRTLISQGCDPDKKNNAGYSFNDLCGIVRKKVRLLKDKAAARFTLNGETRQA